MSIKILCRFVGERHIKQSKYRSMQKLEVKKILIPTDFSETANLALEHAVHLAKIVSAEIYLLHVVSTFSFRVNLPESEIDDSEESKLSVAVSSQLKQMADQIAEKSGVAVHILIGTGSIKTEVVKKADEIDADLIVLGTHGVSGLKEFFMGSNAFRIVSDASCPVLSVQSTAKELGFKNLIVPIDNSFHSREKLGISVKIALTYGSTIHVCGLRSHDHDDEDINAKFKMKMKQVEDYLTEKEVPFGSEIIFCSNIANATIDYANQKNGDLIIMMNEQEVNAVGWFLGPFAQQIVNHSTIPVLSIRPSQGVLNNITPY